MAASGRCIFAFQDILEVEDFSKTESDFAIVEPELESIYQKLGNALDKIISGNQLASSIRMKADEYRKSRLPMSGKLKLWMVHRYYQRSTHLAAVYAYEELRMISYDPKRDGGGIKAMQSFYNDWVACINRAQAGVDPTARFALFLQQVELIHEFKDEMKDYEWASPLDDRKRDSDAAYHWLLSMMPVSYTHLTLPTKRIV